MFNKKPNDIEDLPELIPDLSDGEFEKFRTYFDILEQFNSKMNLVSQSTIHQSGRRHFADCHIGIKSFEKKIPQGSTVHDFGSGNGFPGLIFAVMRPDVKMFLVERDRRKCEFLKHVAHQLEVKDIEIHAGNARDLPEASVEYAVSRAMSPLSKILLEIRTVMKSDCHMYLFKGEYWTGEFGSCPPQLFDYWDVEVMANYQLAKQEVKKFILDCHRTETR